MKILAYIFSFYLLFLNAYPCIDASIDMSMQNIELSSHSSDKHQDDADQCSPFCTCNCCITPIISPSLTNLTDFYPFQAEKYIIQSSSSFSSSLAAIWQPPKLV